MALKHAKILDLATLKLQVDQLKRAQKKIVLCYGHFNVIHPGHLRFLSYAKANGDFVICSIMGTEELAEDNRQNFFSQEERSNGVANLELIDAVVKSDNNILEIICSLAPHIYLKGKEFEDQPELVAKEKKAVEDAGGKIVFSSGAVEYSSAKFFSGYEPRKLFRKSYDAFLESCKKHDVNLERLKLAPERFKNLKMVVIGDTIVDQFVACDPLGLSSEAPVMVVRELNSKQYMGGAAIISQHVQSLGAQCTYVSVLGPDEPGRFVEESLNQSSVRNFLLRDESRPTTFKIRYVVGHQKVLRVSRLSQHNIPKEIEDLFTQGLETHLQDAHGVILSDFVYGMVTPKILDKVVELQKKYKFKIFGDTQCSSQFGDVSRFQNITLITPTEKEARIALNDQSSGLEKLARDLMAKTNNEHLVITLGGNGILVFSRGAKKNVYDSDFFSALEENPVDLAGAGDAMLTGYALSLCAGLNVFESSILASCMSAVSIMRMGNIPIQASELTDYIDNLIKYREEQ